MIATMIALTLQLSANVALDLDFDAAAALWKEFQMPVPPSSAIPVIIEPVSSNGETYRRTIALRAPTDERYFGGSSILKLAKDEYRESVLGWDAAIPETGLSFSAQNSFSEDFRVAAIVHAHLLGHTDFARRITARTSYEEGPYMDAAWIGMPRDDSLEARTAFLIATKLVNDFIGRRLDDKTILGKLVALDRHRLVKEAPMFKERGLSGFIRDLRDTMSPSTAEPGSAPAVVDALVNLDSSGFSRSDLFGTAERRTAPVIKLGMNAILPLADELDRNRLTRFFDTRFRNSPPSIVSMQEVASRLLLKVAGGELGQNWGLDRDTVLDWYEAKRSGKVESWLMSNLTEMRGKLLYPNGRTWDALGECYPNLLQPALARLRAAGANDYAALQCIVRSQLERERKTKLLVEAAKTNDPKQARNMLTVIRTVNADAFHELLGRMLDQSPAEYTEEYCDLGGFVSETENPVIWAKFDKLIGRADLPMRMCLLTGLSQINARGNPEGLKLGLAILRRFFDNSSRIKESEESLPSIRGRWISGGPSGDTLGEVALKAAAYATGILSYNVPKIDANGWRSIRSKIEKGDYSPYPGN